MTLARHTIRRRSQAGFTLIEVITGVAISTFLVMVAGTLFQQNEQANAKNVMRFKMEDTVRFAMDTINEKLMLAGHTDCGELRDYGEVIVDGTATGYTNGNGLLYQAHTTALPMTKLQGYDGDEGDILPAANWSPNLVAALTANSFNVDDDMDAVIVRSLGKHIFEIQPPQFPMAPLGGFNCINASNTACRFLLNIDNPLIDNRISFDNDPVFYDISYPSKLYSGYFTPGTFFPAAITNCVDVNEMGVSKIIPTRSNAAIEDTSLEMQLDFEPNTTTAPMFTNSLPITTPNTQVYLHAANHDLIFVDDSGVLRITRPAATSSTTTGLNSVALTPPLSGGSGDVIITGFRLLYGITTAAGLPRGFVRPGDITSPGVWDSVRLVRYALAVEIVNYHPQPRDRSATNLLDLAIAADNSRNLRRIYEQVVVINN